VKMRPYFSGVCADSWTFFVTLSRRLSTDGHLCSSNRVRTSQRATFACGKLEAN
jgi:hypothetical protein